MGEKEHLIRYKIELHVYLYILHHSCLSRKNSICSIQKLMTYNILNNSCFLTFSFENNLANQLSSHLIRISQEDTFLFYPRKMTWCNTPGASNLAVHGSAYEQASRWLIMSLASLSQRRYLWFAEQKCHQVYFASRFSLPRLPIGISRSMLP